MFRTHAAKQNAHIVFSHEINPPFLTLKLLQQCLSGTIDIAGSDGKNHITGLGDLF
jgi:hypothetical protein